MYWEWWQGGLGLAFVAIGYHLTLGRTFGFSGMWERIIYRSETQELSEAASLADDEEAFLAAMMAATEAAISQEAADSSAGGPGSDDPLPTGDAVTGVALADGWWGNVAFVVAVFSGGLLAALMTDQLSLSPQLDQTFASLFGAGPSALLLLLAGGCLIGFGTRMAGGCTSGHGLNGCGRLQFASILATLSFFGTGILVSWLLEVGA